LGVKSRNNVYGGGERRHDLFRRGFGFVQSAVGGGIVLILVLTLLKPPKAVAVFFGWVVYYIKNINFAYAESIIL